MKADVVIIGAGPAGLLLGHLLRQANIDALILERRSKEHVLSRIRAGVLETGAVNLMRRLGLAGRLDREGIIHQGLTLVFDGDVVDIDIASLTSRHVTVYGQTELTLDLIEAASERDLPIIWEAEDVRFANIDTDLPAVRFLEAGAERTVSARFVAGCDGYHGPSRNAVPADAGRSFEHGYPFGWLGVLADVEPCHHQVVYANHENGFALASMRTWQRSRYYIQVPSTDNVDDWPDDRFWKELKLRLGPRIAGQLNTAPAIEKSIAPLRSFVFEPMRYGSLFLAGDAAHIVPPTGAKGLNLAASDIAYLSDAFIRWFRSGEEEGLLNYSPTALARVWKSERFSWWLTNLMHRFPRNTEFERRMRRAEFDYIAGSQAAQTAIAENYAGLPL